MTDEKKILQDWLALKEWQLASGRDIPQPVLDTLTAFLGAGHADQEAQDLYRDTLSTLFKFYQKSAHTHQQLLGDALVQLGKFSMAHFWDPAVASLYMSPSLDPMATNRWADALQLSPEARRQLETERFHSLR